MRTHPYSSTLLRSLCQSCHLPPEFKNVEPRVGRNFTQNAYKINFFVEQAFWPGTVQNLARPLHYSIAAKYVACEHDYSVSCSLLAAEHILLADSLRSPARQLPLCRLV